MIDASSALMGDVRYAARTLVKSPTFTAAAVLTLAIGLTGTVAMFALMNGVVRSPLPVRAEDELVVGWRERPGAVDAGAREWPFTSADLEVLRRDATQVVGVAGVGYTDPWPMPMADGGEAFPVRTSRVTGTFFDVLGVAPQLGRTLGPDDDRTGAENVLVVSHGLWQGRFGGDPDVVGRRISARGQRFTIVGVMPKDVDHPRHVQAWMTVAGMQATTAGPQGKQILANELYLLARLRPGATVAVAREELRALTPALDALRTAGDDRGFLAELQPYRARIVGDVGDALAILLGAVGVVLLLACANVTGLLLVRGDARRGEFAVRAALGAGRAQLMRQGLIEGLLLAGLAGVSAVVLTVMLLPQLLTWVPNGLPRVEVVRVDGVVIAVSALLTCVTAVLTTWLPGLAAGRITLVDQLKDSGRGSAAGGQSTLQRALVTGQVALAVAGLVGVGLLLSSVQRLRQAATALATEQLVIAPLEMPQSNNEGQPKRRFIVRLVESIAADPRVTAVTPVNATPFDGKGWEVPVITAEGQSNDEAAANPSLSLEEVEPSYFRTFEVPVVRGRAFTDADREGAVRVAIVTTDVAARLWPGQDPLGKRVKWGNPSSDAEWLTVVGIAASTGYRDLRSPWPSLYVPAAQMNGWAHQVVVRSSMPLAAVADLVRSHARALDPDVQVMPVRPFADLLEEPFARPRFYASLMTVFGVTGVALAAVGLYGAVAASVRHRRREIGIRLALGADVSHTRRLVLREGAALVAAGVALGVAMAWGTTGAMRGLLYGVDPFDPFAVGGAVIGTVLVALLALVAPLRSAARIEPSEVLRAE